LLREAGDDYAEIRIYAPHFDLATTPSSVTMRDMAAAAFDIFQAARALESAGVERAQAEAIAEAIQQRQDYATKSDVAKLGSELRAEIAALETRLTNRFYAIAFGLAATVAAFGLFA